MGSFEDQIFHVQNKQPQDNRREQIHMLPEDCLSLILSFTSPIDAFRSSSISSAFRSAMESDAVWETFLPSNYVDIVSRLDTPLTFSSKKELFLLLCNTLLIDGGSKSIRIEKSSGKIIYMVSARQLSITLSDVPTYWRWIPSTQSSFGEVAVLITTWWLEIEGKIRTRMLSPNTKYGAFLKVKICKRAYGLDSMPSQVSVEVGNHLVSSGLTHMKLPAKQTLERAYEKTKRDEDDEWDEIELGEFITGEFDEEVKMILMETKGCHLKAGLLIEGIEVRPKL